MHACSCQEAQRAQTVLHTVPTPGAPAPPTCKMRSTSRSGSAANCCCASSSLAARARAAHTGLLHEAKQGEGAGGEASLCMWVCACVCGGLGVVGVGGRRAPASSCSLSERCPLRAPRRNACDVRTC